MSFNCQEQHSRLGLLLPQFKSRFSTPSKLFNPFAPIACYVTMNFAQTTATRDINKLLCGIPTNLPSLSLFLLCLLFFTPRQAVLPSGPCSSWDIRAAFNGWCLMQVVHKNRSSLARYWREVTVDWRKRQHLMPVSESYSFGGTSSDIKAPDTLDYCHGHILL